jgi:hypothetical protein
MGMMGLYKQGSNSMDALTGGILDTGHPLSCEVEHGLCPLLSHLYQQFSTAMPQASAKVCYGALKRRMITLTNYAFA